MFGTLTQPSPRGIEPHRAVAAPPRERSRFRMASHMPAFILAAATLVGGCTLFGRPRYEFAPQELSGRAEDILETMRIEDKVAQMVVAELEGSVLPSSNDRRLIGTHGVGGVIVPKWSSVPQSANYIRMVRVTAATNPRGVAPFIIMDDPAGLGGRVQPTATSFPRLLAPSTATSFPRPLALAAGCDIETVSEVARLAGSEMRALGVTMAFGPVADVCDRADRPTVSLNCFGSDPTRVADMVTATVRGYQSEGVISAVRHFPGLGAADQPPTAGVPVVVKPPQDFARQDLLPFKRAVDGGADALLVSHAVVSAVDSTLAPASMSRYFLTELVRHKWGYDGLLIADALDQRAISTRYKPGEATVRAIRAGADMVVWRTGYSRYMATMQVLCDAIVGGQISIEQVNRSVLRILRVKEKYGLLAPEAFRHGPDEKAVGSREARRVAWRATRHGVTILKNEDGLLPLGRAVLPRVALVTLIGSTQLRPIVERYSPDVTVTDCYSARLTRWNPDGIAIDRAAKTAAKSDVVIVTVVPVRGSIPRGQRNLLRQIARTGKPIVGLVFGVPIDLSDVDTVRAAVATYTSAGRRPSGPGLEAAVACVFGAASFKLLPPAAVEVAVGEPVAMDFRSIGFAPPGMLALRFSGPPRGHTAGDYFPLGMDKRVKWEFGDGAKARGIKAQHIYDEPGTYAAAVVCEDPFGEKSRAEFKVVVGQ